MRWMDGCCVARCSDDARAVQYEMVIAAEKGKRDVSASCSATVLSSQHHNCVQEANGPIGPLISTTHIFIFSSSFTETGILRTNRHHCGVFISEVDKARKECV